MVQLDNLSLSSAYYLAADGENGNGKMDFRTAVLAEPAYYLNTLHRTSAILNIVVILLMGVWAYQLTRQVLVALLIQFTPFLSSKMIVFGFRKVTSDILLATVTLFLVMILLKLLQESPAAKDRKTWYKYAVILGVLSGFGIATKITFLVLMIIPLLLIPGLKPRILYLATTLSGAFVFTLPIVSRYVRLSKFLKRIFTHKGTYGHGDEAILDLGEYVSNLMKIIAENVPLITIVLISAAVIIYTFISSGSRKKPALLENFSFKMLVVVTTAQLFGILVVARHFKSKYLLPVLCLSGLVLYLVYLQVGTLYRERRRQKRLQGKESDLSPAYRTEQGNRFFKRLHMVSVVLLVGALTIVLSGVADIHRLDSDRLGEACEIQKLLETQYKDYEVIHYYGASSAIFGLMFGNNWTPIFAAELEKFYGEKYFYQQWMGTFSSWSFREKVPFEKIKKQFKNKIILYGRPFRLFGKHIKRPPVKIEDLFGGEHMTIYKVLSE